MLGARMPAPFPRTRSEITDSWLTHALRQGGGIREAGVVGHEVSPLAEPGQTGDVVRIALRYDRAEPDAPKSLIAKFAAPFEAARQSMHALGLYEREVRFYQDFGADPGISIPRGYHSEIDLATGDFVILMEDMQGCRNGDFWTCPLEDVEVALRHLAPFHAKWWQSPVIRQKAWLRQPDDAAYHGGVLGPLLQALVPALEAKYPDAFKGTMRDCARLLAERWDEFWRPRSEHAYTLVHTDYHPKQLFFPTEAGGRFAVFDWQSVQVSLAGSDVQRILAMGLRPAVLCAHRDRLIALYHGLLREHGVDYPLEQLALDVRQQLLISLYIMVFALVTTDVSILEMQAAERGIDWRERIFDDFSEILEDNRVIDLV